MIFSTSNGVNDDDDNGDSDDNGDGGDEIWPIKSTLLNRAMCRMTTLLTNSV